MRAAELKLSAAGVKNHIKAFYELPPEEITENPELYEEFRTQIELEIGDYYDTIMELEKLKAKPEEQATNVSRFIPPRSGYIPSTPIQARPPLTRPSGPLPAVSEFVGHYLQN